MSVKRDPGVPTHACDYKLTRLLNPAYAFFLASPVAPRRKRFVAPQYSVICARSVRLTTADAMNPASTAVSFTSWRVVNTRALAPARRVVVTRVVNVVTMQQWCRQQQVKRVNQK